MFHVCQFAAKCISLGTVLNYRKLKWITSFPLISIPLPSFGAHYFYLMFAVPCGRLTWRLRAQVSKKAILNWKDLYSNKLLLFHIINKYKITFLNIDPQSPGLSVKDYLRIASR